VVERADGSDPGKYVLKRLKNPKRRDYFDREIRACLELNHPNVLRIIDYGETPKGKPFLVTEYCEGGSLQERPAFAVPLDGLKFFDRICEGVACAHEHEPPIYHLDIKPENIFLRNRTPVVGDFGICFIEENEVVMTSEGPRGSMYYCAPEFRGPRIRTASSPRMADVYSLGKVLYWLFTHEVYDGHEEDYSGAPERQLAELFPTAPEFTFIDELVAATVRRDPNERAKAGFVDAVNLRNKVDGVIARIEAGGRVLDLRKPMRCLFCANGLYKMFPDYPGTWPVTEDRLAERAQRSGWNPSSGIFNRIRDVARNFYGSNAIGTGAPIPLILVCQNCGNVQNFRLDIAPDALGVWRP